MLSSYSMHHPCFPQKSNLSLELQNFSDMSLGYTMLLLFPYHSPYSGTFTHLSTLIKYSQ